MTDGERLVWAATYALTLERGGDSVVAVRGAAIAVTRLREVAVYSSAHGLFGDERDFIDEIVNVP